MKADGTRVRKFASKANRDQFVADETPAWTYLSNPKSHPLVQAQYKAARNGVKPRVTGVKPVKANLTARLKAWLDQGMDLLAEVEQVQTNLSKIMG